MRQNKLSLLKIRLTDKDLIFIRQQAEAAGLPASTYVRGLALGHTMRSESDASILDELRVLGGQLGSIGGLCKQLWKAGVDPAATKAALDSSVRASKALEQAAARLAPR